MWAQVPPVAEADVPSARSKHASVLHGQFLYLLGGRNGNVPLRDFWKYNIAENSWERLRAGGDAPGSLQEHTMVGFKDTLYVFGGEVGFSSGVETPLWMYNIKENSWRKFSAPKGVVTPKGRRSHTATVFQDSMYVYGGYQDLKGSLSELWAFHFASETWHLVSQGGVGGGGDGHGPPKRHRHTAVLHDSAMWVFGGMSDLQERADFWRFDFVSRRWRPVKSKPGPGCLHSHCAVKFLSVMIVFGGERDGQVLNEMWRFHFATEFWERLTLVGPQPMPRTQTSAFIFSQFITKGSVHYMGLPEQNYFGSQPEPTHHQQRSAIFAARDSVASAASAASSSVQKSIQQRMSMQASQSKESLISDETPEVARKYTFAGPDSCLEEVPTGAQVGSGPPLPNPVSAIGQPLRSQRGPLGRRIVQGPTNGDARASQWQRLDAKQPNDRANANLLRDLPKISQFNLARLSQYMSYSTFSNESCESLNTTSSTVASPCSSIRTAKSRSSQQFLGSLIQTLEGNGGDDGDNDDSNKTPTGSNPRESSAPSSPRAESRMTRDPASVPNFGAAGMPLQKSNSLDDGDERDADRDRLLERAANALAQASAVRHRVGDDATDGLELAEVATKPLSEAPPPSSEADANKAVTAAAASDVSRSDSAFTFQSYDCSSSRSSTLSSQASSSCSHNGGGGGGVAAPKPNSLCKSSSVNHGFDAEGDVAGGNAHERDVEAARAFYSSQFSLSGYESVDQWPSPSDAGDDDDLAAAANSLSFANPHFMTPDAKAMLDKRRADRTNCLLRDSSSHQSFAQALNSPADSLQSDLQEFHSRLQEDFVELQNYGAIPQQQQGQKPNIRPKSAVITNSNAAAVEDSATTTDGGSVNAATTAVLRQSGATSAAAPPKPSRPLSAAVDARSGASSRVSPANDDDDRRHELMLLLYILGGKESGQVTLFKRGISVWRLDLTKTF